MRLRITFARFILRFSSLMQKLPIMVMRPDDLVEFSRQTYEQQNSLACWSSPEFVDQGLTKAEALLLANLPCHQGQLLLLGVGGGREAIPLAKLGFLVTGVDYIPSMVENAKKYAAKHDLVINGLVQEISCLEVPAEKYDVVWLSTSMYSTVPTRQRRIRMLQRFNMALKPEGFLVCQFHFGTWRILSAKEEKVGKILSWLTLGNMSYEHGDMLWHNIEYVHSFTSQEEITAEFKAAGLEIVYFRIEESVMRGSAVLKKPESSPDGL